MRYRFYREHKFVSAALNDVERLAGTTNFKSKEETKKLQGKFQTLVGMLKGHSEYEMERIQLLSKRKKPALVEQAQKDHDTLFEEIKLLETLIQGLVTAQTEDEQLHLGDQFHLAFRKFVSDQLRRLYEKEVTLLPEIQRLFTDEDLKKIEARTYHPMSPDDMVGMVEVVFPHLNPDDKKAILQDMKDAEPEKYKLALPILRVLLEDQNLPD